MKYLILGAGPAGLTVAYCLWRKGESSFLVLEKENEVGGLCRSRMVDKSPLDIGGGHFLDTRRKKVVDFLFKFMPREEWNYFERNSQIYLHGQYVSHPLEANIWQFPQTLQRQYLESIAKAGCNRNLPKPTEFIEWIYWKFGRKIAEDYMIPYNRKMFANELNELGTYWLEKLPNVSYEQTLLSCKENYAYGEQPGHASFYYPRQYGFGEPWYRIGELLKGHIEYNSEVFFLNIKTKEVKSVVGDTYCAECIINTTPWKSFCIDRESTEILKEELSELKSTSIEIRYFPQEMKSDAHWIYYPQPELPYHRRLLRNNFALKSTGYWTETRTERIGMFSRAPEFSYINKFAYPLNTIKKEKAIKKILNYAKAWNIYGLGRWGEHMHYNSDVVVDRAMRLAEELL